ncbi:nicotinate-nucleotide pyrophosphorylase [carboxylating], chloroplastic, partial [Olea europaea subsp. europaea]
MDICIWSMILDVMGIQCSSFLQAMADSARPAYILETRKTAPGLRLVDKWAV